MKVEDYKPLAALVKGYELKPDHSYLFVCDGKKFSYELANALLKDVRDHYPNIGVFIIATPKSKGIEVREKHGEPTESIPNIDVQKESGSGTPEA